MKFFKVIFRPVQQVILRPLEQVAQAVGVIPKPTQMKGQHVETGPSIHELLAVPQIVRFEESITCEPSTNAILAKLAEALDEDQQRAIGLSTQDFITAVDTSIMMQRERVNFEIDLISSEGKLSRAQLLLIRAGEQATVTIRCDTAVVSLPTLTQTLVTRYKRGGALLSRGKHWDERHEVKRGITPAEVAEVHRVLQRALDQVPSSDLQ